MFFFGTFLMFELGTTSQLAEEFLQAEDSFVKNTLYMSRIAT